MIIDDSIVNNKNFLILVVVRVAVSLTHLTASGPSCMSDSHGWADRLFGELVDQSLYAI